MKKDTIEKKTQGSRSHFHLLRGVHPREREKEVLGGVAKVEMSFLVGGGQPEIVISGRGSLSPFTERGTWPGK